MSPCIPHHKISIISESEVSIAILCLLCSPCYTAVRIKNCLKSMSAIKVATTKKRRCCTSQLSFETEVSIAPFCHLCSTRYTAVQIKNCLKSTSVIKVATMKKHRVGQFLVMQRKLSCATAKLIPFTVSTDEWNTKEDTGKFLKNALDVLRYAIRHLSG